MHPIFAESDGVDNLELGVSSHKMIIFAHHHKVMDGVQVGILLVFASYMLIGNQFYFLIKDDYLLQWLLEEYLGTWFSYFLAMYPRYLVSLVPLQS